MSAASIVQHTGGDATGNGSAWLTPLHCWARTAAAAVRRDGIVARVVVAAARGSTPREVGTCMLVGHGWTCGTIGGGELEWRATEAARMLLSDAQAAPMKLWKLVLGTELAQCCGGVVELCIERYAAADVGILEAIAAATHERDSSLLSTLIDGRVERRIISDTRTADARLLSAGEGTLSLLEPLHAAPPQIWLYGAGHVGQALVRILEQLPLQVTWIDSRAQFLPADVGETINVVHAAQPLATLAEAPRDALFLVMTHSHALDYSLCRAILQRGEFAWAGVIGSRSKGARFRSRLARAGIANERIARLVCPIGIAAIDSKVPGVIAVAVAAQLLQAPVLAARLAEQRRASEARPDDTDGCHERCASCGLNAGTH